MVRRRIAATAAACLVAMGVASHAQDARDERPGYARFERKAEALGAEEFARVRGEVLRRCQLGAGTSDRDAPWYFHYELGRTLARAGDPQRALDALIEAALRKRKPQRGARLYGMWFTDYIPYAEIARVHVALGNEECARDALALSEAEGEMDGRREELRELRELVLGGGAPRPEGR